jgi:hypothetical protein
MAVRNRCERSVRVTRTSLTLPHVVWLLQIRVTDPNASVLVSGCSRSARGDVWALQASRVTDTCAPTGASFVTQGTFLTMAAWPSHWPR